MAQSELEDDIEDILSASESDLKQRVQREIPIALGLQGSGAYSAFAWGVVDYILAETAHPVMAVTAAGSGTLTASALASGMAHGGREGAQEAMRAIWYDLAGIGGGGLKEGPLEFLDPFAWNRTMLQQVITSPYMTGPFYQNPLDRVIRSHIDFDDATRNSEVELFCGAAEVKSGRYKIFSGPDITPEVLLACNATPNLFRAVEIDGEPFWDGAMVYNPALFPLYANRAPSDILIPVSTPMYRDDVPESAWGIRDRVEEISGAASLSRELRALDFVKRLASEGRVDPDAFGTPRIHLIQDPAIAELSSGVRYFASRTAVEQLFEIGRDAAARWFAEHGAQLGSEDTTDLRDLFL